MDRGVFICVVNASSFENVARSSIKRSGLEQHIFFKYEKYVQNSRTELFVEKKTS